MRGYRAIALTISTSIFMQFHDATALNTALPTIARELQVPVLHMDIAILAYQVALVVFVPAGGLLAARLGARNAFALALFVFMCGSLLCATSESLTMLAAARAVQGVGGAVMMPLGRLIVVRSTERSELISAMNWLLVPGIMGPMLGPAVGGLIVQYASWHWIFLINVPIALIGIVMTLAIVPDVRDEKVDRFDTVGVLLLSPFMISLVLGLAGVTGRQPLWVTFALLAASLVFGRAYYRHARRAEAPVLDLSLFAIPSFRVSTVASSFLRIVFQAAAFLIPLWFQLVMHMSAAQTGVLLIATSFGALLSRFVGGALLRFVHPRSIAVYGTAALALLLLFNAALRPEWPLPVLYIVLGLQGLAMAIGMLVLAPAAYVDVEPERMAAATSLQVTVQQLTMSLGIIAGVWAITGMRWLTNATPHDNSAYSGSMIMLGILGIGVVFITRTLDADTLAQHKPKKQAV